MPPTVAQTLQALAASFHGIDDFELETELAAPESEDPLEEKGLNASPAESSDPPSPATTTASEAEAGSSMAAPSGEIIDTSASPEDSPACDDELLPSDDAELSVTVAELCDEDMGSTDPAPEELAYEGQPRRATHDGVIGADISSPMGGSQSSSKRPLPSSAPMADRRRRVQWAPGVVSPKPTRETLHKRAREMSEAELGESGGDTAATSTATVGVLSKQRVSKAPRRFSDESASSRSHEPS